MKNIQSRKTAKKKSPAAVAVVKAPTASICTHAENAKPSAVYDDRTDEDPEFLRLLERIIVGVGPAKLEEVDLARCLFSAGYIVLMSGLACEACTRDAIDRAKKFAMADHQKSLKEASEPDPRSVRH